LTSLVAEGVHVNARDLPGGRKVSAKRLLRDGDE
jgi:hypothetical protein